MALKIVNGQKSCAFGDASLVFGKNETAPIGNNVGQQPVDSMWLIELQCERKGQEPIQRDI